MQTRAGLLVGKKYTDFCDISLSKTTGSSTLRRLELSPLKKMLDFSLNTRQDWTSLSDNANTNTRLTEITLKLIYFL